MKRNIKDLLKNMKEKPSPRCWESIEQQLPSFPSQTPPAESMVQEPSLSGAKNSLFQKSTAFWAKTAIITVSSVAATTLAVVGIMNITDNDHTAPDFSAPVEEIVIPFPDSQQDTLSQNELLLEIAPVQQIAEARQQIEAPRQQIVEPVLPQGTLSDGKEESVQAGETIIVPENKHHQVDRQDINNMKESSQVAPALPSSVSDKEHIDPIRDEVAVPRPVKIEIPNIITPNGDGINDLFTISGIEYCEKNRLIIRDKTGKVVFQTTDYKNDWGGAEVTEGVYYYSFYFMIHYREEVKNGVLTVIKE